jgi:hypothetical protein
MVVGAVVGAVVGVIEGGDGGELQRWAAAIHKSRRGAALFLRYAAGKGLKVERVNHTDVGACGETNQSNRSMSSKP